MPVVKLSRTGRSFSLVVRIMPWQFMQVWVGGIDAWAETSTVLWQ